MDITARDFDGLPSGDGSDVEGRRRFCKRHTRPLDTRRLARLRLEQHGDRFGGEWFNPSEIGLGGRPELGSVLARVLAGACNRCGGTGQQITAHRIGGGRKGYCKACGGSGERDVVWRLGEEYAALRAEANERRTKRAWHELNALNKRLPRRVLTPEEWAQRKAREERRRERRRRKMRNERRQRTHPVAGDAPLEDHS